MKPSVFLLILGLGLCYTLTSKADSTPNSDDEEIKIRCVESKLLTEEDPLAHSRAIDSESRRPKVRTSNLDNELIYIPVVFHVCRTNDTSSGNVPLDSLQKGITNLNEAHQGLYYNGSTMDTGFRFFLQGIAYWDNTDYFTNCEHLDLTLKARTAVNQDSVVNVYTCSLGPLGFAYLPSTPVAYHGIILHYQSFPPSSVNRNYVPLRLYQKAYTLVHEMGHVLGLLHTFDHGCIGMDSPDTAPEALPYYGTCDPVHPDLAAPTSCPGGQKDPINNFMDYSQDQCMRIFTQGQIARMHLQMSTFNPDMYSMNGPLMCYTKGTIGTAKPYELCLEAIPRLTPTPDGSRAPIGGWCHTRGSKLSWGNVCCPGPCSDFKEFAWLFPTLYSSEGSLSPTASPRTSSPTLLKRTSTMVIDPKSCALKVTWSSAASRCKKKGLSLCRANNLVASLPLALNFKTTTCQSLTSRSIWSNTACAGGGVFSVFFTSASNTTATRCDRKGTRNAFVCCR